MSKNHPMLAIITADKNKSADDLVENIRKTSNDSGCYEYENCKIYVHNVVTKYYETKISLLPIENLESVNQNVKNKIEGILVYFDPKDRSFLNLLPAYKNFIKDHDIEFSILLCTQLDENEKNGITFDCIKKIFNKFDIIELERKANQDDETDILIGYDELQQALEGFKIPNFENSNFEVDDESSDDNLDCELEKFENLVQQVMQFRPNTTNMSREDRLNCAQNFAEVFEKIILQDTEDIPNE